MNTRSKKANRISINDLKHQNSPFAIKNFILGNYDQQDPKVVFGQPQILEGISFIMCIRGNAEIRLNLKEYKLTESTILTILPEQIIDVISGSNDLLLEILFFSFDFISDMPRPNNFNMAEYISKHPCLKVSEDEMQDLLEFHTFIAKQYNRNDIQVQSLREDMIKGLLFSLLARIGSIYMTKDIDQNKQATSHHEELIERFLGLLKIHHKEERSVSFYADKMFLTSKYLSTTIKKITGKSISTWINFAIIMQSKVLLKTTDLTVTQISEELNFPNPSFFGRLFKKHTGMTPIEYRES